MDGLDGYFKLNQGYTCTGYVGSEGFEGIGAEARVGSRGNDDGVLGVGVDGDEGDARGVGG